MGTKGGQPYEQAGYLLTQVSFLKQRIVNAALKDLDITYVQFVILAGTLELGDENGIVTQQDISTKRRLDKAMVSNVVKTLIGRNLIKREEHPSDKRAFTLGLTEEGKEIALKGKEIARSTNTTFFAGIDVDLFCKTLKQLLLNDNKVYEEQ